MLRIMEGVWKCHSNLCENKVMGGNLHKFESWEFGELVLLLGPQSPTDYVLSVSFCFIVRSFSFYSVLLDGDGF